MQLNVNKIVSFGDESEFLKPSNYLLSNVEQQVKFHFKQKDGINKYLKKQK